MVLLVTTPTILSALETLSPSSRDELQLPHSPAVGSPISHAQVIALARYFTSKVRKEGEYHSDQPAGDDNERGDENIVADQSREQRNGEHNDVSSDHSSEAAAASAPLYTLDSFLRGTRVYVPPPPPKPEPSSEYLALKARLQAAAEEEAYKRLLSPPSTAPGPSPIFSPSAGPSLNDADADADNDNDPLTPSLVLNIFLSVLLCGFSTFWALTNFQTPAFLSFARAKPVTGTAAQAVEPAFVLISIFAGLLVGVAEVAVYAAYLRKVRQARKKEKATKERKVVVGTVGDGDGPEKRNKKLEKQTATDDDSVGEKEEIWGRGVNGGVRRRVRERWRADNNDGI